MGCCRRRVLLVSVESVHSVDWVGAGSFPSVRPRFLGVHVFASAACLVCLVPDMVMVLYQFQGGGGS